VRVLAVECKWQPALWRTSRGHSSPPAMSATPNQVPAGLVPFDMADVQMYDGAYDDLTEQYIDEIMGVTWRSWVLCGAMWRYLCYEIGPVLWPEGFFADEGGSLGAVNNGKRDDACIRRDIRQI
jgi:hypothetical protein